MDIDMPSLRDHIIMAARYGEDPDLRASNVEFILDKLEQRVSEVTVGIEREHFSKMMTLLEKCNKIADERNEWARKAMELEKKLMELQR